MIRCTLRAALASDELSAAAHVVLHPGRLQQVIWVALDLADVERRARHQISDVVDR